MVIGIKYGSMHLARKDIVHFKNQWLVVGSANEIGSGCASVSGKRPCI